MPQSKTPLVLSPQLIERFWSKVAIGDEDDCWLWQACLRQEYGSFWTGERTARANRVAWEIVHGQIPEGLFVCHTCDIKRCVNPAHLFLGTHADNMADMSAKGRHRAGIYQGSQHGQAKLSEEDIPIIRELYAAGVSHRRIAARFRVAPSTIGFITQRKTWRHVAQRGDAGEGE